VITTIEEHVSQPVEAREGNIRAGFCLSVWVC
jgi:hypothetical protein